VVVLSLSTFIALGTYAAIAHSDDSAADHQDHLHHHHFAEFAKVPEKARAQHNPFETDPSAVAAGKKLFEQHCAECHGATAEGGRKAPNLRAEEVQQATPGTLFWILTNGVVRRGMPVWSKLPEPQRWQIITFLKSLPPSTASFEIGQKEIRLAQQIGAGSERERQFIRALNFIYEDAAIPYATRAANYELAMRDLASKVQKIPRPNELGGSCGICIDKSAWHDAFSLQPSNPL